MPLPLEVSLTFRLCTTYHCHVTHFLTPSFSGPFFLLHILASCECQILPHTLSKFHPDKHFLRRDLTFAPPGAHLLVKWTKTLQDHKSHHVIQLPELDNMFLCPVRALKALLASRPLSPSDPLFANSYPPYNQVIDSHIRYALKQILILRNIPPPPPPPPLGHGFHTFRRSGATYAFDHNVALQNIMAHGLWRSSSVWTYLQNASQAASIIPLTFSSSIPPNF